MAYEFAKAHPGLSVTMFDLPEVIEMSGHFRPHDADDRVSFVAGLFNDVQRVEWILEYCYHHG